MQQQEQEGNESAGRQTSEWHSDRADIVEQQLNPSRTIAEVKALLLGTTFGLNESGAWYVGAPDEAKRILTDEGVSGIISYLEPLLSSQVALAHFTEKEPSRFAKIFADDLAMNMTINWNMWFSKRFVSNLALWESAHDRIKKQIVLLVYAHFTRAIGGKTHKGIVDMSRRIEHSQVIQREEQTQSPSFMDKFKVGLK